MSPNAYVCFDNSRRLLCGFSGHNRLEDPTFVWTYSVFERHLDESITPSMYQVMSGYVADNISRDDRWAIEADEYHAGHLEAAAVDYYFELPINVRITMHEQELVNLRAAARDAAAKESAAIDAMLEENKPFNDSSPIDREYADFMRGLISKSRDEFEKLGAEIHEEEQWRGGHEETEGGEMYDPMDEF